MQFMSDSEQLLDTAYLQDWINSAIDVKEDTSHEIKLVVRFLQLHGPVAVQGDVDEHEALGVEGGPANEESDHNSYCVSNERKKHS